MLTFARVYGPDVTYNPRTAWSGFHLLRRGDESVRDAAPSAYVSLTGGAPLLIFRAALTDGARALVTGAGLPWLEQAIPYGDEAEYTARLRERSARPRSVVFHHAHPPDPSLDSCYWIPRDLLTGLNDKALLGSLVPSDACPPREVMSVQAASALPLDPGATIVFKASTGMSTGSGGGVVIARTEAQVRSLPERLEGCETAVVEAFQPFVRTMCVTWAADYLGEVHYIGSADQIVTEDGTYLSSWIGPDYEPPATAVALGRQIMQGAVALGYVGYAGFDVGILPDGRALVFDLNFRICASTPALLWYEEARRRLGPAATVRLVTISARTPFEQFCGIGQGLVAEGAFLPMGAVDTTGTIWADRPHTIRGVLLGRDRAETEARCEALLAQGLTFR